MSEIINLKHLAERFRTTDIAVAKELELAVETIEKLQSEVATYKNALEHLAYNDMLNMSDTARLIAKRALK